jgi:hypothetical protein
MKVVWGMAAMLWLCGCSSFNKEWKAASSLPGSLNSIEGRWTGEWGSDRNGHRGELRCVVSKSSDATYRAHYHATFWKIFWFTYVAKLNGQETNGTVHLRGEANLGKLAGGVYKYEGTATPTEFRSTYASKHDHGTFDMSRPAR